MLLLTLLTFMAAACKGDEDPLPVSGDPSEQPSAEPSEEPSEEPSAEPETPIGDLLLDVEFTSGGDASDKSASALTVNYVWGSSLLIYYNEDAGVYVPRFAAEPGSSSGTSFYRARYTQDSDFAQKLAEGHSLDCILMCDFDPSAAETAYAFSSLERGGSGIYVDKTIKFELQTSRNSTVLDSGIRPERGVYYHVTGTYDHAAGTARLFVDGELRDSREEVSFSIPSVKAALWYGIGIDSSPSGLATGAWKGDVVMPRIYEGALTAAGVRELHSSPDISPFTMNITDADWLDGLSVKPGTPVRVYARGLENIDGLQLSGQDFKVSYPVSLKGKYLEFTPEEEISGEFFMTVSSGRQVAALGTIRLTVSEEAEGLRRPSAVAHRGWWLSTSVPQNSLASLAEAQDGGCEYAEMDIWITTDGEVFVNHDGVLDGVTIQNSSSDNVRTLKLTNGEPIPTLDGYLDQHSKNTGTVLVIEVKTHSTRERNNACVDAAIKAVHEHGLEEYVQYIAFDLENCSRIASAEPGAMVGYLNGDRDPAQIYGLGIMQVDYTLNTFTAHPEWVRQAHDRGMLVNMWTLDNYDDIKSAIALGADMITTNYPERVFDLREKYFD